MVDDIVERLRATGMGPFWSKAKEAADEIEQLRERFSSAYDEIERLRASLHKAYDEIEQARNELHRAYSALTRLVHQEDCS